MPAGYREVSPQAVFAARGQVRLIDVREPPELDGELGYIAGVEPVPLATLAHRAEPWDRDDELVLVCRSGARSARGAEQLVAAGFRKVMNLTGGMLAYCAAQLPSERRPPAAAAHSSQEGAAALPELRIEPFYDARTSTLTYVIFDPASRDAVILDPVLDYDPASGSTWTESVDRVSDYVRAQQLRVHWVLETHAHADHLSASQLLRRRFDARVAIGARIREVQETFRELLALPASFTADGSQFDRLLTDGEMVSAGTLRFEVIATPGHTPACVSYRVGDAVFTGDALFLEDYGTGRCDFPRGSAAALYDSIQRLYALPEETRVFVGHDYQPGGREVRWETTIGASRARNPQLCATTSREAFLALRQARDATLAAPRLLFPSVQVNIAAGRLPAPHANGHRYLMMPLNVLRPADELGEPLRKSL